MQVMAPVIPDNQTGEACVLCSWFDFQSGTPVLMQGRFPPQELRAALNSEPDPVDPRDLAGPGGRTTPA